MDAKSIFAHVPPIMSSTYKFSKRPDVLFRRRSRTCGVADDVSTITSGTIQGEVTWQIVVGSIAGVTPFVVAGIEFSKRIVAQKKCGECGGGLVLMEKEYVRCPECGGFLPWQSWRRFFTG